ncbi:MAG TPA: hypothetical protein DDY43_00595 [Synechococcales bacterium UBA10510]|nr:hypothetical protein [Synechococcales bacterium UBA10510]
MTMTTHQSTPHELLLTLEIDTPLFDPFPSIQRMPSGNQVPNDAAAVVAHDTCQFLSKYNQLTPLHRRFIRELAGYYLGNYLGSSPERLVVTAPPGLGKTTTLRFFLRWAVKMVKWDRSPKGILVCSNQIEELENHYRWLQEALGGGLEGIVALHHSQANRDIPVTPLEALEGFPIVLSTQAMIRRQKNGDRAQRSRQKLNDICFYKDTIRMLCWDEEAIATRASHIQVSSLEKFSRDLEELADDDPMLQFLEYVVKPVIKSANAAPKGKTVNVPIPRLDDFTSLKVERSLKGSYYSRRIAPIHWQAGFNLATWNASTASVHYRYDPQGPGTVMDFVVELPNDIQAAVITDASAAVNKLIKLDPTLTIPRFMQENGDRLKRYDHLELITVACGGGRRTFITPDLEISKHWKEHIKKAAAIADERLQPDDLILVVTFRGEHSRDRHIDQVKQLLQEDGHDLSRYHFITYGYHRATNEYSQVKAVLLFGTFHLDQGMLLSSARSQTRDPLDDDLQEFTLQQLADSQTASDIQQALGRGCCREVVSEVGVSQGKPMLAFVGLNSQEHAGVLQHLETAFPGFKHSPLSLPKESMRVQAIKAGLEILKTLPKEVASVRTKELQDLIRERFPDKIADRTIRAVVQAIVEQATRWEKKGHTLKRRLRSNSGEQR